MDASPLILHLISLLHIVALGPGPSGKNSEYLLQLGKIECSLHAACLIPFVLKLFVVLWTANALRTMGVVDEHVFALEQHLMKLLPASNSNDGTICPTSSPSPLMPAATAHAMHGPAGP